MLQTFTMEDNTLKLIRKFCELKDFSITGDGEGFIKMISAEGISYDCGYTHPGDALWEAYFFIIKLKAEKDAKRHIRNKIDE